MSDDNDQNIQNATFLIGWTKNEKLELFKALKACGSENIEFIMRKLPSKSKKEIEAIIFHYRSKALEHPEIIEQNRKKKFINTMTCAPLTLWAKYLLDMSEYSDLQTETATALRLIAEFEDIPLSTCTSNIDFRLVYHTIANAMEGKVLPDDPQINALLEKCMVEAAYTSKAFIKNTALKTTLGSVNISDKAISIFPRPTENHELGALRHLASQRGYNPLNIPENYLKPSVHLLKPIDSKK